jgi:hypothetical protein
MKRTETHLIGLRAKFLWRKLVLYNKNGLVCLNEWKELIALLIGKAFFVENPIKIGKQIRDLFEIIFQANCKSS